MKFPAINPATEEVLVTYTGHTPHEVDAKLTHAVKSQKVWKTFSFAERKRALFRVARLLRRNTRKYATLITEEMGKPITQSLAEVEKCAWACDYFASHAEKMLHPIQVKTEARKSFIAFEPMGVILGIMPWNFPFWQFFRFAAPTVMAGNAIILKHASNVPGCALALQEIFHEANVPHGLVSALLVDSKTALKLIDDPRIVGVSVTGSTNAGKQIAERAGMNIKKCVLELGGSDPFVVVGKPKDVQDYAHSAVQGRIINGGQSCIAAKRFIIPRKVVPEFEKHMTREFSSLNMGDPFHTDTEIGPLARSDLKIRLLAQIKKSIQMGARPLTKNTPWKGKGYYVQPTLLQKISPAMPVFSEETFGPLAGIMGYKTLPEAIALANATPYGLGASIWTTDLAHAEKIATRIQAGNIFINKNVTSDPRLPFGGVKESGLGKELGEMGIREFVNSKTTWIN